MSRRWAGGSTRAWRVQRARVLVRDGGLCLLQLEGCSRAATCVHHLLGKGVSERDSDLVSACQPCNNRAGDPTKDNPRHKDMRWPGEDSGQ